MEGESPASTLQTKTASAGDEHSIGVLNLASLSEMDDPEAKPTTSNFQIDCSLHHNAANSPNGTPSKRCLIFGSLFTTISAGLYIFDFVSNVLVAKQYYDFDYRGKNVEGIPNKKTRTNFIAMVTAMVIGHIGWGIAFMTSDVPRKEHPLLSAYFFPLLQFRRILRNLWNPLSKDSSTPNERKEEALYAIVSAAIEGGPLIIIQYSVLALFSSVNTNDTCAVHWRSFWIPHALLFVSLVVSVMSTTYNVIRAMVFIIPIRSLRLGLAAGSFTLSNLMLQWTTLATFVIVLYDSFPIFILLAIYVLLTMLIPIIGFYILTRQTSSQRSFRTVAKSIARAVGFAYVSALFGSLYPLVSIAQESSTTQLSTKRFRIRLFLSAAYQMILEVLFVFVLTLLKETPCLSNTTDILMPCFLYKAILSGGFVVEVFSLVVFALLVRSNPAYIQPVNTPVGKYLSTADGSFNIFQAGFNIVGSVLGS